MARNNKGSNLFNRPYDVAIPSDLLAKIVERRRTPDGIIHHVPEVSRAGRRCYSYPFPKMELGDFFIVSTHGRSEKAMRIACHQAAARHDLEIAITPWTMPNGLPGIRVCLVIIGVNAYKHTAEKFGVKSRFSDGKWRGRKHAWEVECRNKTTRTRTPRRQKLKQDASPFWADDAPLPIDTAIAEKLAPPEVKRSRAEIIADAIAKANDAD